MSKSHEERLKAWKEKHSKNKDLDFIKITIFDINRIISAIDRTMYGNQRSH